LDKPASVLGVLARDEPTPSTWRRVVRDAAKPVIVVPEMAEPSRPMISRVLVPLDGTPEAAGAVAEAVGLFAGAGIDVVVLHVFDASTVPRFWDQAAHARRAWEEEFMTRFCAEPGARLELRSGEAGQQVVDVAATEGVDLITLGWSQRLDPGRAQTVRRTVLEAAVPVMLVPLAAN
jgi:nucleotide-binding universal stress UspA family protein